MKWLKRILVFIIALLIIIALAVYLFLKSAAPDYKGDITLSGLSKQVKVVFDEYGVPHIYAENRKDAYFSLGYVHAQDRLFQMEMLKRVSEGKLAEILGPELLSIDKSMRILGMAEMGKRNAKLFFSSQDQAYQSSTLAYLDGINTFIKEGDLPLEFTLLGFEPEPFKVEDVYSIVAYMSFGFTSALSEDPMVTDIYKQLGDIYLSDFGLDSLSNAALFDYDDVETDYFHHIAKAKERLDAALPVPVWQGSNSWAISGEHTSSGKPILANDTHIPYSQPAVWYEAYMEYDGHKLYGYYLGAVPFAIMGHNDYYGWGLTIFPVDQFDLYQEKLNPDNNKQYWHYDHWQDFSSKTETFKIKGAEDVSMEVQYNHHGPLIDNVFSQFKNQNENTAISLWWIINHMNTSVLPALYDLNNANSMDSFEKGVKQIDLLGLNIIYADQPGNIAYWSAGTILQRPEHVNPLLIIDGSVAENELIGYYPFEKNPKTINPENGIIVTANNAPKAVDSIVYAGYYSPGYRAQRIEDLLATREKWNVEESKEIQLDVFSERDVRLTQLIISQLDEESKKMREVELLQKWDGKYDISSIGATIYSRVIYYILEETLLDELGEKKGASFLTSVITRNHLEKLFTNNNSPWWDNIKTKKIETRKVIFQTAFTRAIASLHKLQGTDSNNWEWGKYHVLEHIHPIGRKKPFDKIFNVGPFAKSGGLEVVDKENFHYNAEGDYPVSAGPAMRLIMDFANPNNALGIIPTGQSGNIMSPHYADQAEMYVKGEYRTHYCLQKDISKGTVLYLKPTHQ